MMDGELHQNRRYEMQSVSQTFELLDILAAGKAAHTLSYLSDCLGMSKNKMFRLLATLEQRGVVERFGSGWYRFGGPAFALARRILVSESVLVHARPLMVELAGRLNEAVYLATYKNGTALFQDMVDCTQIIKSASFVGADLPWLQEAGTQPAPSSQAKHLSHSGVTVIEGSLDPELTTVSAEFSDSLYLPAGALVVVAPTFRMSVERIRSDVTPALLAGVQRISLLLGSAPDQNSAVREAFIRTGNKIFPEKLEFVLPVNHQQRGGCHQPWK